ncbi:MAG: CpsD/CapB family tyrosine-protein kinase [candidate division Zixibacteria bacterium]|nr:CpsD/CapB family tyrosine-protein kinase [candidate division Zixibacteria bacterium]
MKKESIINYYDRETIEGTEFRRLYSNIKSSYEGDLKSVMITSSTVEEGKSTIASFLSISIAETSGEKILLLDTDLRRPMVHNFFKLPKENGLADILDKKCSIKQAIKQTSIPDLSIITAGKVDRDPTLLLNQNRLREVFEELKFYFDLIIVDVPPIIPVSDPIIIASEVDSVLLVIRVGMTPKEVVKRAANFLKNSKINIAGVILNNFEEVLPYYYRSRYYSNKYYNKTRPKIKN